MRPTSLEKKVILRVKNEEELLNYKFKAEKAGLVIALITDLGKTEIPKGSVTCLGIGPAENYAWIPLGGKWVLILCMLLGRLEIYTVLIAFAPISWRE